MHGAGASRVAIWPDKASVSPWSLPAADLAVTLFQLIESGTGPAAYYADMTQDVITLAVTAKPWETDSLLLPLRRYSSRTRLIRKTS